jgi:hypothetical protein
MLAFLSFFEELEVDEQATEEAPPRRRPRMPRRPGGDDGTGGTGGRTPGLQRLALLAGVVILVAVIAIWQIRSCQRDAEVTAHKDFVADANTVAKSSASIGKEFSDAFIQQGQQPERLLSTVQSEITKQQQAVQNAQRLSGPGGLGDLEPYYVNSMQYRESGLRGVHEALTQAFSNQNKQDGSVDDEEAQAVAATLSRLIASDVVYEDSYRVPARRVLADKNIEGVNVDASQFLDAKVTELASPARMKVVLDDILGGGTSTGTEAPATDGGTGTTTEPTAGNGRHGLSLISTSIVSGNSPAVELSTQELNEADATNEMVLRVVVENSGDFPESDLTVTALIDDKEKTASLVGLDKGEQGTVDIPFSQEDIDVSLETTITVTAEEVPEEFNKENNQQKYRVQFKLAA